PGDDQPALRRIRILCEGAEYRGRGRNSKWNVEIALKGGRIERLEGVNLWNPDIQPVLLRDNRARFECVTTGGFSAVDLWLEDSTCGKLSVQTNFGRTEINLAELDREDHVLNVGGLDRRLRIFRLPDEDSLT